MSSTLQTQHALIIEWTENFWKNKRSRPCLNPSPAGKRKTKHSHVAARHLSTAQETTSWRLIHSTSETTPHTTPKPSDSTEEAVMTNPNHQAIDRPLQSTTTHPLHDPWTVPCAGAMSGAHAEISGLYSRTVLRPQNLSRCNRALGLSNVGDETIPRVTAWWNQYHMTHV